MGGQPCYLKILMNGNRTQGIINDITGEIGRIRDGKSAEISEADAYQIIDLFNRMEDDACTAARILLDASGYDYKYPHSLDVKPAARAK